MDIDWPEFNQLVTDASAQDIVQALTTFAAMLDVELTDVTAEPGLWAGAILIASNGASHCVAEPGLDLDERLLRPESADAIAGLLAHDGVFFGFDPAAGTLHVTTYDLGAPTLEWYDSVTPGPSFARTFLQNGRARDEDPRKFALRTLELPESSPLLDRYAFVEHLLEPMELEVVVPELEGLQILIALRIG